jgi:hypothetical protein
MEPQCLESRSTESPAMTEPSETSASLSERLRAVETALEAHLTKKPRPASRPRAGWRPGRCLYGFHPHPRIPWKLVENYDEQRAITVMLECAAQGAGPRAICQRLDSLGFRRRNKKRWVDGGHTLVLSILRRRK